MADVLILPLDGSNGSTTFTDISASPKTVTATGNAQISTAQSKYGGASAHFDGSAAYLSTTDATIANFGTGDFTVECYVRHTSSGNYGYVQGALMGTNGSDKWWFGLETNVIKLGRHNTSDSVSASWTPTLDVWYHLAVVRASGVTDIYIDGTSVASSAIFSGVSFASDGAIIGAMTTPRYFDGYIDDLRINKGEALYTANFTPPGPLSGTTEASGATCSAGYTLIPGNPVVVGLIYAGYKFGEANTTWSFSCDDAAASAWTTEDTGNPIFGNEGAMYLTYGTVNQSSVKKFGATALFFPNNAYLAFPTGAFVIPSFADFTFEFWINVAQREVNQVPTVFNGGAISSGHDPTVALNGSSGFYNRIGSSAAIDLGVWYHYAVCRKANILRHYLNGHKYAEAISTGSMTVTSIGHGHWGTAFYLDSIGFANGYAHYDSNDFTPALTSFYYPPSSTGVRLQVNCTLISGEATGSRITPVEADTQWNKTVLLLGGGGNVGSKVIVDAKGRTVYNQSDVVYSDAHKKYAQTSLYFNGSSKLVIPPARNLDLIDGDFTIDFWIYPTRIQTSYLYSKWSIGTRSYIITLEADGKITFTFYDSATATDTTVSSVGAIPVNEFSFVSVGKHGNDYRVWTSGTGGTVVTTTKTPYRYSARQYNGTTTWDADIVVGASGADAADPDGYFQGYIEDFRVTNGFARYTESTYVPPLSGFLKAGTGGEGDAYWNDVNLLIHYDEPNGTTLNIRDARGHALYAYAGGNVSSAGMYGGGWANNTGYMKVAYGAELDLSSGDFTLEVWCGGGPMGGYLAGNSYGQGNRGWNITASRTPTDPNNERAGGLIQWTQWDSNGVQDIAISPLFMFYWDQTYGGPQQRWHHVCVQRRGNDITIFIDSVGATTTITRRPAPLSVDWYVNAFPFTSGNNYAFRVYDEFRFTRAARYVGNTLTVPTGKYPEQAFSYGASILSSVYSLIPGQVKAASVVDGITLTVDYSVTPPLIIGKPSVEGSEISHTFALVAADATGGEGIPEDVAFSEALVTTQAHNHSQVFYVNDVVVAQATKGVAVRLGVTDFTSAVLVALAVTDDVQLTDARPTTALVAKSLSDAVTLGDSAPVGAYGVVVSVAIDVSATAAQAVHQAIEELVTISSGMNTRQDAVATDTFAASSMSGYAGHIAATDGVGFLGTAEAMAELRGGVAEAITFHGALTLDVVLYVAVSEDVALADIPTPTLLFQAIVQDHVQFKAFFASPAYTTWAMNTRNAAVTQYANFNFNSFAKMGERYIGANDQGLYWLDGDDDAGRAVNSRITTGVIQPNGNKLSGVQYAYLGMRGDGSFVVTVTDEAGGSYNYTLTGSSMETARVAFGRGFKTRYFTFSLESQGQDFDLDSVEFITTEMARKVQR